MPPPPRQTLQRRAQDLAWRLAARPLAAGVHAAAHLVVTTSRLERTGPGAHVDGRCIWVSWHRDLPLLVVVLGERRAWFMISGSPYMRPIRRFCAKAGLRLVVGTSGQGGKAALALLGERAREGGEVYLAVDGPAGPAFRCKPGCVRLAQLTGLPIVPVTYAGRRPLALPARWDGMEAHLPGERFALVCGEPLHVSPHDDEEAALRRVQAGLEEVERLSGRRARARFRPGGARGRRP